MKNENILDDMTLLQSLGTIISFLIPTYLYLTIASLKGTMYMYLTQVNTIVEIKKMAGLPK